MKIVASLVSLALILPATLPIAAVAAETVGTASSTSFAQELLDAHNVYRKRAGVPPLVWSNTLERSARTWAERLTANVAFEHDTANRDQGENLWMGTDGAFSLTEMVGDWASERQYFRSGTFPVVSTTGNWSDVGHYTQMVWRTTTRVGCAGLSGPDGNYRLVCRYTPPGNVMGQPVF